MSSRKSVAVMGVKPADYKNVLALADAVANALTLNAAIYTLPDPTIVALQAQATILRNLITAVNDGDHSKIELRNEASELMYSMLQDELVYVNKVGNHDRGVLELSGFPVSAEPEPRPVPDRVVIKRIDDGPNPNTAKIFIEGIGQGQLFYIVQTTTTPDIETSWKDVLKKKSSRELIITNLVFGQVIKVRVCASNTHGDGPWSEIYTFVSRR